MKVNALSVVINRPLNEVFLYVMTPTNTPKWTDSVAEQEAPRSIKKGSKYRNKDHGGQWTDYVVTELVPQKIFELTSKDGNYHARFSYEAREPSVTELTFTEWVDIGGIQTPFPAENLEKLKNELEKPV